MRIISRKNHRGFTLIELLVVVAIIGVLASVVLVSLNSARAKARDARRMSDVKQIQNALELYFDNYGYYPQTGYIYSSSGGGWSALGTALASYISSIPVDPLNQAPSYYEYDTDPGDNYQTYGLAVNFESSSNSSKESGDGGYYSSTYEVGQQPVYCRNKYITNPAGNWQSSSTVCNGGD